MHEEKHLLPEVILPGGKKEIELSLDPLKVRNADEVWMGMVHEGETWFYKRGDTALKLIDNINKYKILSQQMTILRNENMQMAMGILWFNKSEGRVNHSIRKAEERCVFPFTVLENVTLRMECKIGDKVHPGNYEVWIGPVHEAVALFYDKGDQVLKLDVIIP